MNAGGDLSLDQADKRGFVHIAAGKGRNERCEHALEKIWVHQRAKARKSDA
jgi:hypothetical protein